MQKLASNLGCLVFVGLFLIGIVVYPRGRWLFAFALLAFAALVFNNLFAKDTRPFEVAVLAENLLEGRSAGWDVDDYEHLNPHEARLRDLWLRTMQIGGLPEEWVGIDEAKKKELRETIRAMRELDNGR